MLALGRVGLAELGAPAADEEISKAALVLSLRASFRSDVAGDAEEGYALELDGESFAVRVHPGWAEALRGPTAEPRLTITTTARRLAELLSGALDATAATSRDDFQIDGPRRALDRFLAMFAYPVASH